MSASHVRAGINNHITMEIKGTIILAMPEVSGVSRSGNNWKKREYVLENTEGSFPRKVAFTCFGENADRIQLKVGDKVNMFFDIESREFNGRWYTDIRCWRCDVEQPGATTGAQTAPTNGGAPLPPPAAPADEEFPF